MVSRDDNPSAMYCRIFAGMRSGSHAFLGLSFLNNFKKKNLLVNESKCNNATFGTQNSPFNMCCYSISVIFHF